MRGARAESASAGDVPSFPILAVWRQRVQYMYSVDCTRRVVRMIAPRRDDATHRQFMFATDRATDSITPSLACVLVHVSTTSNIVLAHARP